MSPRYMIALAEVDYIITELDTIYKEKIPENFKKFVKNNKAKQDGEVDINNLKEETYAILAFIYRKFLASKEEKEKLELEYRVKLKEEKETLKLSVHKEINYSPKVLKNDVEKHLNLPITYKKSKWYINLFNKIKLLLKR